MQQVKEVVPMLDMIVKNWTLQNIKTQENNASEVDRTV